MATKNDITGDSLISKKPTDAYRDNYDAIFRSKKVEMIKADEHTDYPEDEDLKKPD